MYKFTPFKSPVQSWNSSRIFCQQKRELMKQITYLLDAQCGLAQTHPENYSERNDLVHTTEILKQSIRNALGL